MDAFESTHSFYPTSLTDYDVTLHPQATDFNALDGNLNIDLESFAGHATGSLRPGAALREGDGLADERHSTDISPLGLRKHALPNPHGFDEAYSDVVSNYDQQYLADQPAQEAKTPPLDSEDPLLKFSPPNYHYALLDYSYRAAPVSIEAQLNGMFFNSYSDGPPVAGEEAPPQQQSVTCYRRNLFSIVGSATLPRSLRYIVNDRGEQIPILSTEATLSATESMEGAAVKLISVPFKSGSVPAGTEEKADKDPSGITLDLMGSSEMDSGFVTFPLVWKRLQFRSSTANNGRRKELQQTYSCRVSLIATLSTGQRVSLCDMTTEPIVVRGRSPRAFAAKKEAPTSGSMTSAPRAKPGMARHPTADGTGRVSAVKSEADFNFALADIGVTSDPWNGRVAGGHHGAMTAMPAEPFRMNPNEFLAQSSPDISRYTPGVHVNVPAPVNLSLTDDDVIHPSPGMSGKTEASRKMPRLANAGRPVSFSLGSSQNHNENDDADDPLYE